MRFELSQSFVFESAHSLRRDVPALEREPSMRIHGHTYTAEVTVVAERLVDGMVADLYDLRQELARVRGMLDHRLLDDVAGLVAPTLEGLCEFIENNVRLRVHSVTVSRASGDRCRMVVA